MALISKFVFLSLIITLLYLIGLLMFIAGKEENKCQMTYMFQYPQFVKIELPVGDEFPRYGLYAYSEGKYTAKAREMKFSGIPVVFVPGNAGSHKQVRSLASVALRNALSSRPGYHFDFFTVDLNNELSGLNGALLNEQTNFLNHSLNRVLSLYDKSKTHVPKSVIVIGHSMGGVIAHSVVVGPNKFPHVDLLLTLASPHRRPTVCVDDYTADYYETIEQNMNFSYFKDKTFVTIGGGSNDHLVHSWLTNSNYSSLNVISTAIPKVWLSTDHECIMWCKQLVLAIVRALFDSVDLKTKQLSSDHNYRLSVFKHHLLKNSGTDIRLAGQYKETVKLDYKAQWYEDLRRRYTIDFPDGTNESQWHMIRLLNDPKHGSLFVQTINLELTNWIYACTADVIQKQSRYCETGIHLSHLSKIAPSSNWKRRTNYVDLHKLKKKHPKLTHVILHVTKTDESVTVNVDVHNPQDRLMHVQVPRWYSLSRTLVIQKTEPEALHYEIHVVGLQHVIQTYLLYVEPIKCTAEEHHAVASLVVPWAHHDSHTYFTETQKKPLQLRLQSSRPLSKSNSTARVYLTLDPACQYTVSIRNSYLGMLTQFASFYSPLLIANVAAVILMSYRSQLLSLDGKGYCTLFQKSLSLDTKPYYLVTSAKLISRLLSWNKFSHIISVPDTQVLIDENFDFLILPLLLYCTAVGLTYLLSLCIWVGILLSESTIQKFVIRFVTQLIGGAINWSEWFLNALHRVPCIVAVTLCCLSFSTCGSLALFVGGAYYFLKLTQLCQNYIEVLAYEYIKFFVFKITKTFRKNPNNETNKNELNKTEEDEGKTEKVKVFDGNSLQSNETVMNYTKLEGTKIEQNEIDKAKNETPQDNNSKQERNEDTERPIDKSRHNDIHFHFSLFLMWCLIAALSAPSVITWARNFYFSRVLVPDPSFAYGVILCVCAVPLWQMQLPKTNIRFYKQMATFVYSMALICLTYVPLSLHRLPFILTTTIVITVLHQLFAPNNPENENVNEEFSEPDPIELINDIKTKLE